MTLSCAQTVHLHNTDNSDIDFSSLISELESRGFRVKMKGNAHPQPSRGNLLIFPSKRVNGDRINEIVDIFNNESLAIETMMPSPLLNHHYNPRNYGIYLRESITVAKVIGKIAEENVVVTDFFYESVACADKVELAFNEDGTGSISQWEADAENEQVFDFHWKQSGNIIRLSINNMKFNYQETKQTKVVKRGTQLDYFLEPNSNYPRPFNCSFLGGVVLSG